MDSYITNSLLNMISETVLKPHFKVNQAKSDQDHVTSERGCAQKVPM